jgi:hypothetical protein
MKTIRITEKLREKVGQKRNGTNSASFRHGKYKVDVAYRAWEDIYEIYEGERHIASFCDVSTPNFPRFDTEYLREGYQLEFEALETKAPNHHFLGKTVSWHSQSSGTPRWKRGTIVEIVPPGKLPTNEYWKAKNPRTSTTRKETSFIVVCDGTPYWPRTQHLNWKSNQRFRNTLLGPKEELLKATTLSITTKAPQKWVLVDTETQQVWVRKSAPEWKSPQKGIELIRVRHALEKIAKNL